MIKLYFVFIERFIIQRLKLVCHATAYNQYWWVLAALSWSSSRDILDLVLPAPLVINLENKTLLIVPSAACPGHDQLKIRVWMFVAEQGCLCGDVPPHPPTYICQTLQNYSRWGIDLFGFIDVVSTTVTVCVILIQLKVSFSWLHDLKTWFHDDGSASSCGDYFVLWHKIFKIRKHKV